MYASLTDSNKEIDSLGSFYETLQINTFGDIPQGYTSYNESYNTLSEMSFYNEGLVFLLSIINNNDIETLINIFTDKGYNELKYIIFKSNRHAYRTICNYNSTTDDIIQTDIENQIISNNTLLDNILCENGISTIINEYRFDYDETVNVFITQKNYIYDIINNDDSHNNLTRSRYRTLKNQFDKTFLYQGHSIFSNEFIMYLINNIISKQLVNIQKKFYTDLFDSKVLNKYLIDYIIDNIDYKSLLDTDALIKLYSFVDEEFIIKNQNDIDIITLLKHNIFREETLLLLSTNQPKSFWDTIIETQNITESFIINNSDKFNIYLYSQNRTLSTLFVSTFEDKIDWNNVLEHNTFTKDFLKDYQFHLLYYLYSKQQI